MRKIILLLLMIFVMPSLINALEMCDSYPQIRTNCTMVTPIIECGVYNYTIFNVTKDIVDSGNMSIFNSKIYQFNFTEGKGDYIIRLCDGTTREVFVREETNTKMYVLLGLGIIGILYCFLIYFISPRKQEDIGHSPLRIAYIGATMLSIIIISTALITIGEDESLSANLKETLQMNFNVAMWMIIIYAAYLLIFVILKITTYITGRDYALILQQKIRGDDDEE